MDLDLDAWFDKKAEILVMDGRTNRASRNRAAICKALLDLIKETAALPSAMEIAARSGTATRSIFRHFTDKDALYNAAGFELQQNVAPLFANSIAATELAQQIAQLIDFRIKVYSFIRPYQIVLQSIRFKSSYAKTRHDRQVLMFRTQIEDILKAHNMCDFYRLESLDLLFSFSAWLRLYVDQKLDDEQIRSILLQNTKSILNLN
jgi:AcrR family transcriptional regulator